jgi:hypothetical protein
VSARWRREPATSTGGAASPTIFAVEGAMRRASTIAFGMSAVAALLAGGGRAVAADSPVGTYARVGDAPKDKNFTMTIERWNKSGAKLTYRMAGQPLVLTVETKLDGSDAPLIMNGQPTGETMGIKRVDGHHASTVLKMNGKQFGTSTGTFNDDFTKLTVENQVQETTQVGPPTGKTTEIWIRK